MPNDNTYTRFYWRFIDEFGVIYDDKLTFGWWMTLLVLADGAHPAPAYLPRSLPTKTLTKLVDCGLVELGEGDRFRVRGVSAERTRRSEAARVGGLASVRSRFAEQPLNGRSAAVERPLNLAEPSQEEISRADARLAAGEFKTWIEAMEAGEGWEVTEAELLAAYALSDVDRLVAAIDRLTAEVKALREVQEDAMRLATGVVLHGEEGAAA